MKQKRARGEQLLPATAGGEIKRVPEVEVVTERRAEADIVGSRPTAAELEARDTEMFADAFTVQLPDTLEGDAGKNDDETQNQEKTFQLRKAMLETPAGEVYAWIPQAVEAFVRSKQSSIRDTFGSIRGLHVDPKRGVVQVLLRSSGEGKALPYEISLEELQDYSIELLLEKMERETKLPPVFYSAEMEASVGKLSESAAYRWDLITRAARQETHLKQEEKKAPFHVGPARAGTMFSSVNGVGVFMEEGAGASRFSVAKVVDRDVPATKFEGKLTYRAYNVAHPEESHPIIAKLLHLATQVKHELEKRFGFDGIRARVKPGEKWKARVRRAAETFINPSGDYLLMRQLDDLIHRVYDQHDKYFELSENVRNQVFIDKAVYRDDHPFECAELPDDMKTQLEKGEKEAKELLMEVFAFLQENAGRLKKALPEPETLKRDYDKQRVTEFSGQLDALAGGGRLEEARMLIAGGEEKKK